MTGEQILKAAAHCASGKGCWEAPICPMSGIEGSCAMRFAEYIHSVTSDGYVDTEPYHEGDTHEDVTIMTVDGVRGFAWYDEAGTRHDEDGFTLPKVRMIKGTVQILVKRNGERSAGWVEKQ